MEKIKAHTGPELAKTRPHHDCRPEAAAFGARGVCRAKVYPESPSLFFQFNASTLRCTALLHTSHPRIPTHTKCNAILKLWDWNHFLALGPCATFLLARLRQTITIVCVYFSNSMASRAQRDHGVRKQFSDCHFENSTWPGQSDAGENLRDCSFCCFTHNDGVSPMSMISRARETMQKTLFGGERLENHAPKAKAASPDFKRKKVPLADCDCHPAHADKVTGAPLRFTLWASEIISGLLFWTIAMSDLGQREIPIAKNGCSGSQEMVTSPHTKREDHILPIP